MRPRVSLQSSPKVQPESNRMPVTSYEVAVILRRAAPGQRPSELIVTVMRETSGYGITPNPPRKSQRPHRKACVQPVPREMNGRYGLAPNAPRKPQRPSPKTHTWPPVPQEMNRRYGWRPILLRSPATPHRKAYLATGTQREMNGKLRAWRPKQNSQRTQCISPCRRHGASNERAGSY